MTESDKIQSEIQAKGRMMTAYQSWAHPGVTAMNLHITTLRTSAIPLLDQQEDLLLLTPDRTELTLAWVM
jgi:hypothetical protein